MWQSGLLLVPCSAGSASGSCVVCISGLFVKIMFMLVICIEVFFPVWLLFDIVILRGGN